MIAAIVQPASPRGRTQVNRRLARGYPLLAPSPGFKLLASSKHRRWPGLAAGLDNPVVDGTRGRDRIRYVPRLEKWDLVILDELGHLPLGRTGAELLSQAISLRHERGSMAITSKLPFSEWMEILHTERLTSAILDRVTQRAVILAMNGPSYCIRE